MQKNNMKDYTSEMGMGKLKENMLICEHGKHIKEKVYGTYRMLRPKSSGNQYKHDKNHSCKDLSIR